MRPQPEQRISKKALTVWRISALIPVAFLWLLLVVYAYLTVLYDWPTWIVGVSILVLLIMSIANIFIIPQLRWKRWRYQVFEHEIELQYGVFIVTRTLIPMVRVQHVDTAQGPLLRFNGLSNVTISTAATVHEIPALTNEEADALRDRIAELARVADENV